MKTLHHGKKGKRYQFWIQKQILHCKKEMKFSIKDCFSKCDQIGSFLRIWSHLLKKSLMENFIFCAVCLNLTSSIHFYFFKWNAWHVSCSFFSFKYLERSSFRREEFFQFIANVRRVMDCFDCVHTFKY